MEPRTASNRRTRRQSGQVLAFFAIALVVLLGMTALAIDVGYAFYVKRSLQASADAAATAGALELPNPAAAIASARAYGGSAAGKNRRGNVPSVTTTVSTKCLPLGPCNPVNAVVVRESTRVKTFFARVVGIDSLNVQARATACSPCGAKPLDVMIVLDRSSSMCATSSGAPDPSCTDLNNARNGIRAFLRVMDPALASVGLAVFPPAAHAGATCERAERTNYDSPSAPYTLVSLSNDYLLDGELNPASPLVATVACMQMGFGTSYATAIDRAQAELESRGSPEADDVIVFLSDGGANTGPAYYGDSSPYRRQPCKQGVDSAAAAKARGTTVYTIGYDLFADGGAANLCRSYTGSLEQPSISADQALRQMASGPEYFYNQPNAGELATIFTRIAVHLTGTRLVDDD
jgi:hypothetical protein